MSTHLRELSEGYPMNTDITGFRCFFRKLWVLVLLMKVVVVTALEGLNLRRGSFRLKPLHFIWHQ